MNLHNPCLPALGLDSTDMATLPNLAFDSGLPANVDAEKTILGAILLDNAAHAEAKEKLSEDDFSLDSHRRIFLRMTELMDAQRAVDIVTLAAELDRYKERDAIGGVAYLASLTEGLPRRPVIEEYIRIVKDKSLLRKLMLICSAAIARAADQGETALDVLNAAETQLMEVSEKGLTSGLQSLVKIVEGSFGNIDNLYKQSREVTGLATDFTEFDRMTSGLQKGELIIIAARPSMGKTAWAINIAQNAAIKLIPENAAGAEARLAGWAAASTLSHPHLMRIDHYGRCQIGAVPLIYAVTEYANEILSQILLERPLTPAEAAEMLDPVIDALAYLHGKGFVHGHLEPSEIMAVDDQLKLSCDNLQRAGEPGKRLLAPGVHVAPEAAAGKISPAADLWSLGVTLVEVLTQHPPVWERSAQKEPTLPWSIPKPFAGIARECLRITPEQRCTLGGVKARPLARGWGTSRNTADRLTRKFCSTVLSATRQFLLRLAKFWPSGVLSRRSSKRQKT